MSLKVVEVDKTKRQNTSQLQKQGEWPDNGRFWFFTVLLNFLMGNKPNRQYFWVIFVSFRGSKQLSRGTNLNASDTNWNPATFLLATMAIFIKFLLGFSFSCSQDPEGTLLDRVAKLSDVAPNF